MTKPAIPVIQTVKEIRSLRNSIYNEGNKTVGFIPTMGFLHDGHLSLVKQSLKENDYTIVSIFVNPSQFAPTEDLTSYPRNLEKDLESLATCSFQQGDISRKVSAVFAPTVDQMYPSGIPLEVENQKGAFVSVLGVSEQLEGKSRPQFFRGVATVVSKLFNVVQPTKAYFGQKDVQQTIVIKRMVKDLLFDIEIEVLPTVRESTGLALSSRNSYLSESVKQSCQNIFKSLNLAKDLYSNEKELNSEILINSIKNYLNKNLIKQNEKFFDIDYISINDPINLNYINESESKLINPGLGAIISLAIKVPNVDPNTVTDENKITYTRLIDNVILNPLN
ncbi:ligase activity protein [[Candida] boidinii]|nr:ligase activity protein [[Candida] boidinii]OWB59625.1 ligase activity protein [[Candida] boidinii]OWB72791.1 ligase activity protein [[Candida] boidinii]OWB77671.1 ligase activity protein [[Candida] boidinii]GME81697.1 unnamed protein product [[Candida] boidinii]